MYIVNHTFYNSHGHFNNFKFTILKNCLSSNQIWQWFIKFIVPGTLHKLIDGQISFQFLLTCSFDPFKECIGLIDTNLSSSLV